MILCTFSDDEIEALKKVIALYRDQERQNRQYFGGLPDGSAMYTGMILDDIQKKLDTPPAETADQLLQVLCRWYETRPETRGKELEYHIKEVAQ